MATRFKRNRRKTSRPVAMPKPKGILGPRVQRVGPERFGIVSVDCAKHRSKWMLTDYYGKFLIPPTEVSHTKDGFQQAISQLRAAVASHSLGDVVVSIERTGSYHLPAKRAYAAAGYEVRIVHPFATKQFRMVANPGNKTDDNDLVAIFQATALGFGLIERPGDAAHDQLQLLARHRRDLVRKNAALRCQIHAELDALMPGFARCFANLFESEISLAIARQTGSAAAVKKAGLAGLAKISDQAEVGCHRRTLAKILAWANQSHEGAEHPAAHGRIFATLHDEYLARAGVIKAVERDLASFLVATPYVLLMSIPGINVASAAEFAGEMGPIGNYAKASAITGRAGLYPSRYQSDEVDRPDGSLVRCANRRLRRAIMLIAENLINCNDYFQGLAIGWHDARKDPRKTRVKIAGRFCRIAYQIVAGHQVFNHPSCQRRDAILDKLNQFHLDHQTSMEQVMTDLQAAVSQIPASAHATEAVPLVAALKQASSRRRNGPRRLGEILPGILVRLGVSIVESQPSGETDLT